MAENNRRKCKSDTSSSSTSVAQLLIEEQKERLSLTGSCSGASTFTAGKSLLLTEGFSDEGARRAEGN
jgi:hypothetical protein